MTIEQTSPEIHAAGQNGSEEWANALIHAAALALSVPAAAVLLGAAARTGNPWLLTGCSIFAATMIAVYAASALSHLFADTRRRRFFRSLDQAFIYTFIVGTYTPFSLVFLRSGAWWALLGLMWAVAAAGFFAKVFWGRDVDGPATWCYLLLGWLPVVSVRPLVGVVPSAGLWWVFIGGLCYTLGVVCLKYDTKVPYLHALWHLAVVAGTAWHYFAILIFVVPAA
ncbi:MAG: hemolysin III family protein [Planctomycetia bacterium]|nr:hemolysin III family protein [Planctomycetia bacterium]